MKCLSHSFAIIWRLDHMKNTLWDLKANSYNCFSIKCEINYFFFDFRWLISLIHLFQTRDQSWFSSSLGCITTMFSLEFSVRTTTCLLKSFLEIILLFHFLQSWSCKNLLPVFNWSFRSFRVHSSEVIPSSAWLHSLIVRYPASEWWINPHTPLVPSFGIQFHPILELLVATTNFHFTVKRKALIQMCPKFWV